MAEVVISQVSKRFGRDANAVEGLSLRIADGSVVTLLGPSGCGKTTTLRMVAGLERPTGGSIRIGDRVVADAASGAFVPPERRGVGMVFQSYALWPHLTVLENVMYPLKMYKVPRGERRDRALAALDQVGIAAKAAVAPGALSGGQQQRVAIARALVFSPRVLLMDEPFSNLDARLRDRMGDELRDLHSNLGVTTIYVTHDQNEAMMLSDEIVVMQEGRVLQHDAPRRLARRPATAQVASFLGYHTALSARVTGTGGAERDDVQTVELEGDGWRVTSRGPADLAIGDEVSLVVRPGVMRLCDGGAHDPATATWPGVVERVREIGDRERVVVRCADSIFTIEQQSAPTVHEIGDEVTLCAASRDLWAIRRGNDPDDRH